MNPRSGFKVLLLRKDDPEIALGEAVHIFVACMHNALDAMNLVQCLDDAIDKVQQYLDDLQLRRRRSGRPAVAKTSLIGGPMPDFPLEIFGARKIVLEYADFGLNELLNHQRKFGDGSSTFPCLKRWIELKQWGQAALQEIKEAHHRGVIVLKGAPHPGARSGDRDTISPSFSFESTYEQRRVGFDGRTLIAETSGPVAEVWSEPRLSGADLFKLIEKKCLPPIDKTVDRIEDCRAFLREHGKADFPPPRAELLQEAQAKIKGLTVTEYNAAHAQASKQCPSLSRPGPRKKPREKPSG